MKKITTILILCLCVMLINAGCSKKENTDENSDITPTPEVSEENSEGNSELMENPIVKEDYDFNDYIKLGQYKGLEVQIEKKEITDKDVDIAIQMDLMENGATPVEVTDRPVQFGDTVNIDFTGYKDGETFEGGSAEGYDLTIGSDKFIEGFEDQLIGAKLNDEVDVNVTFPENYSYTDLAGQPVVFKVKINKIEYFELTDDEIKNFGYDSEEAYREAKKQELISENEENMQKEKENYLYNAVIRNSEITLPDNLVEYYAYEFRVMYNNIASSYGYDLETFLTLSGYTMDDFEKDVEYYSTAMAKRELVVKAISAAEGIAVTDEEFEAKVTELAESYGYESNEEFLENADVEAIKDDILFEKIIDFLVEESVGL